MYSDFFCALNRDASPYPYQERLAREPWPDALIVPTGLGKTPAVVAAWLFKRLDGDADTPRRLVWCVPMRVLVEQSRADIDGWLAAAAPWFVDRGLPVPAVHVLMGGEADDSWTREPEGAAIIIGTQDMLLSRALMRGYGMSRYAWPTPFALLHTDALWVFDEVQLMSAGLATSSQLEAFRRHPGFAPHRPARSLWLSATLAPDWLGSVDFRPHLTGLRVHSLGDEDQRCEAVRRRIAAPKALAPAATGLTRAGAAKRGAPYALSLATEIAAAHRPGTTTLVIVNRVDRAQALAGALAARPELAAVDRLLIHSRFRARERRSCEALLKTPPGDAGRVIVATQAIEAGVDLTSATLFTELAPWASLVQRFGRCNRDGLCPDARVFWIDLATEEDAALAQPYAADDLAAARAHLQGLSGASPRDLPAVTAPPAAGAVLRRRDLLDLFNTDPDLTGFDVDVSPYIRDADDVDGRVFWRALDGRPPPADTPPADAGELCPVSLARLRDLLKRKVAAYAWDGLDRRWAPVERLRPGMTVLLDAAGGGYDRHLGFLADQTAPVEPLPPPGEASEGNDDDPATAIDRFVTLTDHLAHVTAHAERLCAAVGEVGHAPAVAAAAGWHDVGKAHPAFQEALCRDMAGDDPRRAVLWAKSDQRHRVTERPRFRHELASALAWLAHAPERPDRDLVAYLVAAHHGKVRLSLRALPDEREPTEPGRRFARGVWQEDQLPALTLGCGTALPPTRLALDIVELGDGPSGASWTARTRRLLADLGPFRLAWLEALVRLADARASREETEAAVHDA